jgi:hypothetical protein
MNFSFGRSERREHKQFESFSIAREHFISFVRFRLHPFDSQSKAKSQKAREGGERETLLNNFHLIPPFRRGQRAEKNPFGKQNPLLMLNNWQRIFLEWCRRRASSNFITPLPNLLIFHIFQRLNELSGSRAAADDGNAMSLTSSPLRQMKFQRHKRCK